MSVGFFYSKYVEYLDTIFLIVAGKPVSFLQYCAIRAAPRRIDFAFSDPCVDVAQFTTSVRRWTCGF
jgi:hypothetical protein